MLVAPVVGALLGLALAGVHAVLPTGLLGAGLTVALGVLLTRGLHLDGLADTTDALGSYRRGDEALQIMKKSDIGPFGVAAIVLSLLLQVTAVAELSAWPIAVAWTTGRLAVSLTCRRGLPAARPEGLGALVAATVPVPAAVALTLVVAAAALPALPALPWAGPAVVLAVAALVTLLLRHTTRRFGGITGDVIGAMTELATTLALVGLALATRYAA